MRQIKQWLILSENHERANTLMLILVGHAMEQGWLVDRYKRRAFMLMDGTDHRNVCSSYTNGKAESDNLTTVFRRYKQGYIKKYFCTQFVHVFVYVLALSAKSDSFTDIPIWKETNWIFLQISTPTLSASDYSVLANSLEHSYYYFHK